MPQAGMKKPRRSAIHPDDAALFRSHVADVTPLRGQARVPLGHPLPLPIPAQRLRDDRQVLKDSLGDEIPWEAGAETGEELNYTRGGISAPALRKLRRGHWVIQDELDLHGLTVADAREAVTRFLSHAVRRGLRCVRIVHGKGLRSRNREPVLKRKIAGWLMQRDAVLAFCQARPADGGSGAVVVLLQGERRKAEGRG